MSIRSASHIAVGVTDMDTSLAFYRDVLGMHVSLDAEEEIPALGESGPMKRRGVYLRWREGEDETFIVLDQHLSQEPFGKPARLFQVGIHHFGFWVDDIDGMVERAKAAGISVIGGPGDADTSQYGEAAGGKVRSAFMRDPDGNFVQLDQRVD
jgi:catechol 2,3-dioxygenase-like lactoylglutathione lyase family enzyme